MSEEMPSMRHRHERDSTANNPGDQTPDEYFRSIVENRIAPRAETGESELVLTRRFLTVEEPTRWRLRLRHPDTSVSDVTPALDAGEFEEHLRGLESGLSGRIERKSRIFGEVES